MYKEENKDQESGKQKTNNRKVYKARNNQDNIANVGNKREDISTHTTSIKRRIRKCKQLYTINFSRQKKSLENQN